MVNEIAEAFFYTLLSVLFEEALRLSSSNEFLLGPDDVVPFGARLKRNGGIPAGLCWP